MQWIFMLVGLVLGVGASESVTGALLGGLIGLSLGQALRLQGLETRNAQLAAQLKDFAERFERGTRIMHERLLKVEQGERSDWSRLPLLLSLSPVPHPRPSPSRSLLKSRSWTGHLIRCLKSKHRSLSQNLRHWPLRSLTSRNRQRSKAPGASKRRENRT